MTSTTPNIAYIPKNLRTVDIYTSVHKGLQCVSNSLLHISRSFRRPNSLETAKIYNCSPLSCSRSLQPGFLFPLRTRHRTPVFSVWTPWRESGIRLWDPVQITRVVSDRSNSFPRVVFWVIPLLRGTRVRNLRERLHMHSRIYRIYRWVLVNPNMDNQNSQLIRSPEEITLFSPLANLHL